MLKNVTKCLGLVVVLGGLQALAAGTRLQCPTGTQQIHRDDGTSLVDACVLKGTAKFHGPMVRTTRAGQTIELGQWENDNRVGSWTFFDAKGTKTTELEFRADAFHGQRREFYPNGQLKKVERYEQGVKVGDVQEFSQDGKPVTAAR